MYNSDKLWHLPFAWPPSYGTQWSMDSAYSYPVPNLFQAPHGRWGEYVGSSNPSVIQPYTHLPVNQSAMNPLYAGFPTYLSPPIPDVGMYPSTMSGGAYQETVIKNLVQILNELIKEMPQHTDVLSKFRNDILNPSLTSVQFEEILRTQILAGDVGLQQALDKKLRDHPSLRLTLSQVYDGVRDWAKQEGSGMGWSTILALASVGTIGAMLLVLWALKPVNVYKSGALV